MTKYEKLYISKISHELCLLSEKINEEFDKQLVKVDIGVGLLKIAENIQEELDSRNEKVHEETGFVKHLNYLKYEIDGAALIVAEL